MPRKKEERKLTLKEKRRNEERLLEFDLKAENKHNKEVIQRYFMCNYEAIHVKSAGKNTLRVFIPDVPTVDAEVTRLQRSGIRKKLLRSAAVYIEIKIERDIGDYDIATSEKEAVTTTNMS